MMGSFRKGKFERNVSYILKDLILLDPYKQNAVPFAVNKCSVKNGIIKVL